jgi:hypothetical protein
VRVAILPSALIAHFAITSGSPVALRLKKGALSMIASLRHSPSLTSMPEFRSFSIPRLGDAVV